MEKKLYNENFWFNETDKHGDVYGYSKDYYANHLYEHVISKITDIPKEGFIVVLGSNKCVSFNILVDIFGSDRCLGIDIANPTNHPLVKVKNILDFDETDDIPIAFAHNDIGSYPLTPMAKIKGQMWLASNVVDNGYVLSRNNLNSVKFPSEEYMSNMGFINSSLQMLEGFIDMSDVDKSLLEGHMLSKKCKPEVW
jgi:hypothetical protein